MHIFCTEAAIFHFIVLKVREQSSVFCYPCLRLRQLLVWEFLSLSPLPPTFYFYLCLSKGKMNHSTYQHNVYISDTEGN